MYNYYSPYSPPQISQDELLKRQRKFQKHNYRKCFNSVGFNTLLSFFVFQALAFVLSFIFSFIRGSTQIPLSFDSIPNNILNGVISLLGMGVMSLILIGISRLTPKEVFSFGKVGFKKTVLLVSAGFSLCMLSNVITSEFLSTMKDIGIDLSSQYESPLSDNPLEAVISVISIAVVPAISEEMFFRGLILHKLRPYGDGFAVFASSLLFALMHGNFVQIPFTLFVGLALGYVTVYSGSMLPAMIIHFANNAYSVIADILYTNCESLNMNEFVVDVIILAFLVITIFAGIASTVLLSKKDSKFLKLKKYSGMRDIKTRNRLFITSPGIIAAVVFFLSEAILSLFL